MSTTIAHYKIWKVWARMVGTVVLLFVLVYFSVLVFQLSHGDRPRVYEEAMLFFTWICAISVLRALVSRFRQVVFHNARLIWIEDGSLIWRDKGFFSTPCSEIMKVTCGTGGRFDQLDTFTLLMRDGSEKVISTDSLSESWEDVADRLRDMLGLKRSADDSLKKFDQGDL